MVHKRLLRPERLRKIPTQFSWLDHRLIRQARLRDCDHAAWALYLFLCSVSDERGLSYYSDASLCRELNLDAPSLARARQQLVRSDLIAFDKPLCQVLGLEAPRTTADTPRGEQRSVADVLRQIFATGGEL
jgi:hypothetical protein